MRSILLAALLTLSPVSALAAPTAQPTPEPVVTREINFPVEFKDTYTAYVLGMIPFGGINAAYYLSFSRFQGYPDANAMGAGFQQVLTDIGFSGLSVLLLGASDSSGSVPFAVKVLPLVAIPISHTLFYAPDWGARAAQFNREQAQNAGYKNIAPNSYQ